VKKRCKFMLLDSQAIRMRHLEAEGKGAEVGDDVARMKAMMKRTSWMLPGNLRDQQQRLHVRRS